MRATTAGGREIAFRIEGRSGAPCVMLAHGVALDLRVWDAFAARLARDYTVLRYDSRGHGGSSAGSEAFSLDDLAQDAVNLMDALAISNVHFVGLSLGGMVGMGLALEHGARLASVAFCNARASATPEYRSNWDQRTQLVQENGVAAIAEPTIARWFTPAFPSRNPEAIAAIREMVMGTSVDGYCKSAQALKGLDYGDRLSENRVRALFLAGEKDSGAPPEVVAADQKKTPNSTYAELADTGHISVIENPTGFAEIVTRFIRQG